MLFDLLAKYCALLKIPAIFIDFVSSVVNIKNRKIYLAYSFQSKLACILISNVLNPFTEN